MVKSTKPSTFYRSIVFVSFLVFWVLLETAAKDGKLSTGRIDTKGANATEWLEPAGDEANKRTAHGGRGTGRRGRGGQGKSSASSPSKGSGSPCPGSAGTGSKCPSRSQPTDPGFVYIMKMSGDPGPHQPPPLLKVGYTSNLNTRKRDLKIGNPFRLDFVKTWQVCNKAAAEGKAKSKLREEGLNYERNYGVGGGTEWYELPRGGQAKLQEIVRCAIDEYVGVTAASSSSSRNGDLVESSVNPRPAPDQINPRLAPNQAGAIMATNYGHLNPWLAGVYNTKWRQARKGNVLEIKYNCK